MGTFGKTSIGASTSAGDSTSKWGTNYHMAAVSGQRLKSIWIYCSAIGNNIQVACYLAPSQTSNPTTGKWSSGAFTPAVGWNEIVIPAAYRPALTASAWYWLGWKVAGSTTTFRYDAGVASSEWYRAESYAGGWYDPFGVGTARNLQWSIYGEYQPVPTAYTQTISEKLGMVDSVAKPLNLKRTFSDKLGMVDGVASKGTFHWEISEILGMADSAARSKGQHLTFTETLGMADGMVYKVGFSRIISETLGLVDSVASRADFRQLAADELGMADSVVSRGAFHWEISEVLGMADSVARSAGFHRTIEEQLGLIDSIFPEVIPLPISKRRHRPPFVPPTYRKERYSQKLDADQVRSRILGQKGSMTSQYDSVASRQQDLWVRVERSTAKHDVRPELTFYFYACAEEIVRIGERFKGESALKEKIIVRDKWIQRGLDVDVLGALFADLGMADLIP